MGETLEESLQMLAGGTIVQEDGEVIEVSTATRNLAQEALDHYNRAQENLREGDWAAYGEEIDQMEEVLNQLAEGVQETNTSTT